MDSNSVKVLDLMSAFLKGNFEQLNVSFEDSSAAAIIVENRVLMFVTTSIAILVGCAFLLSWKKSHGGKVSKVVDVPKPLIIKQDDDEEIDDCKKRVTVFFGTQTGTAEGFAKVLILPSFYSYKFL